MSSLLHFHYKSLDSTHLWCKRQPIATWLEQSQGVLVSADEQSDGIGRQGKRWHTASGDIAFNLNLADPIDRHRIHPEVASFALITSWQITRWLQSQGVPVEVKWPNDLVTPRGKLGGILVERYSSPLGAWLSIGIGINLQPTTATLDQPSDALCHYLPFQDPLARSVELAQSLLTSCWRLPEPSQIFAHSPTSPGSKVELLYEGAPLQGTIQQIDRFGRLQLQLKEGRIITITSGQSSQLRRI